MVNTKDEQAEMMAMRNKYVFDFDKSYAFSNVFTSIEMER